MQRCSARQAACASRRSSSSCSRSQRATRARRTPRARTHKVQREPYVHATVVGGGLAGVECAYQLARKGVRVRLIEQKPSARSSAHATDRLAELVCSNSLRGAALSNAVGL